MKRIRFDMRDWEAFEALVRLRHFGEAANALGITQSAVSQRMAKLEADLQLKLLTRSNQGVELTDAGQALLPEVTALIVAKRNALEAAQTIRQKGPRPIRLLLANAIIHTSLLPVLRNRLETIPNIAVQVDVASADGIEDRLQSGEYDIAISTLALNGEGCKQISLTQLPMGVAVPDDVSLDSVPIEELCNHPLLMVPRHIDPGLFDPLVVAATNAGKSLNIEQSIIAFPSILAMVAMGRGWGIVPEAMASAVPTGARVIPLQMDQPPSIQVLITWRKDNERASDIADMLKDMA